ncbi:MAG: acetaldehyde dehydrogenase (acetylating) [Desulfovibrionaceae bacterium]|jgi:acetaldehyde dehydrogenase|nr:acetaldehyde dehydrogenase (acetylating) [Desulfovibrionaceae bacterium]
MPASNGKLRVAILGSGNIGTDLLIKVQRSPVLDCTLFIGRNLNSRGMAKAASLGVKVSDRSIDAIARDPDCCDLVFDATSALDHAYHWPILRNLGKLAIDMTPSRIGSMCFPAINLDDCLNHRNINLVTCGGQASVPLAHAISSVHPELTYVEVVSSIASRSAGPATRLNIDEYVETTSHALSTFTNAPRTKAILILNPAEPSINMQTTVFALIAKPHMDALTAAVRDTVRAIQAYVPGYELLVPPTWEDGKLVTTVKVRGRGDYLPRYAGNLDIITSAGVAVAEAFARQGRREPGHA